MLSPRADTPLRLCILGNSHVGSLKRAWDARGSASGAALVPTFFASRHRGFAQAVIRGRHLVAGTEALAREMAFTSGGHEAVALDAYDAFLVYGLFVPAYRDAGQFHSRACRMAALRDHFGARPGVRLAGALRQAVRVPVLIAHDPLPADPAVETGSAPARIDHYQRTLAMVNQRLFGPVGLQMIAQPGETRVPGRPFYTRSQFTKGSRRLAVGDELDRHEHPPEDRVHMNDAFGALMLQAVEASLTGATAAARPA